MKNKALALTLISVLFFSVVAGTLFVKPALAEYTEYPLPGHYNRTVKSPRGTISPNETVNLVFTIQQTYNSLDDYVFTLDQLSDGRTVIFGDAWKNATMYLPDGTKGYITIEPRTDMREMDCRLIEEVQVPYPPDWPKKATLIGNLGVPLNKTYTVWTIECTASLGVLPVGWHHLIVYWGPYTQDPEYLNNTAYLALAGSVFRVGLPIPPVKYRTEESTDTPEPPVKLPTGFLGSSLPTEYEYGIVTVIAVAIAASVFLVYFRRIRKNNPENRKNNT